MTKQATYTELLHNFDLEEIKSTTSEEAPRENTEIVTDASPVSEISYGSSLDEQDENIGATVAAEEPQETEELMAKGTALRSVYWKYFSAGNSIVTMIVFVIVTLIGQLGSSGADYWLAHW